MCLATVDEFDKWNRIFLNNMCRVILAHSNKSLIGVRRYIARRYYGAVCSYGAAIFWDLKNITNPNIRYLNPDNIGMGDKY